jgi:hypothetical protein
MNNRKRYAASRTISMPPTFALVSLVVTALIACGSATAPEAATRATGHAATERAIAVPPASRPWEVSAERSEPLPRGHRAPWVVHAAPPEQGGSPPPAVDLEPFAELSPVILPPSNGAAPEVPSANLADTAD